MSEMMVVVASKSVRVCSRVCLRVARYDCLLIQIST